MREKPLRTGDSAFRKEMTWMDGVVNTSSVEGKKGPTVRVMIRTDSQAYNML